MKGDTIFPPLFSILRDQGVYICS